MLGVVKKKREREIIQCPLVLVRYFLPCQMVHLVKNSVNLLMNCEKEHFVRMDKTLCRAQY